jgi:hypothetical protein
MPRDKAMAKAMNPLSSPRHRIYSGLQAHQGERFILKQGLSSRRLSTIWAGLQR